MLTDKLSAKVRTIVVYIKTCFLQTQQKFWEMLR